MEKSEKGKLMTSLLTSSIFNLQRIFRTRKSASDSNPKSERNLRDLFPGAPPYKLHHPRSFSPLPPLQIAPPGSRNSSPEIAIAAGGFLEFRWMKTTSCSLLCPISFVSSVRNSLNFSRDLLGARTTSPCSTRGRRSTRGSACVSTLLQEERENAKLYVSYMFQSLIYMFPVIMFCKLETN